MKTKLSVGTFLILVLIALFNRGQGVTTPQLTAGTSGAVVEAAAPSLLARMFPFLMLASLSGDSPQPCTGPNECQATPIPTKTGATVKNILIIDSGIEKATSLKKLFEAQSSAPKIQIAINCELAIGMLESAQIAMQFDLILLDDLYVTQSDRGHAWVNCLERIRSTKRGANLPVILMSAFGDDEVLTFQMLNVFFYDAAGDPEDLLSLIDKALAVPLP